MFLLANRNSGEIVYISDTFEQNEGEMAKVDYGELSIAHGLFHDVIETDELPDGWVYDEESKTYYRIDMLAELNNAYTEGVNSL